jgi:RNA polymerase sigma-70 factor (ECF subfamily)
MGALEGSKTGSRSKSEEAFTSAGLQPAAKAPTPKVESLRKSLREIISCHSKLEFNQKSTTPRIRLDSNHAQTATYQLIAYFYLQNCPRMFGMAFFFQRFSKSRKELPDLELISNYRSSGDSAFVAELFERYSVQIYAICKKYLKDEEESKDAAMEVFEYLLKELMKYEVSNFKSWLARATGNFCLMRIRKRRSQEGKEEDFKKTELALMESSHDLHPEAEATAKELELQRLELAMEDLNAEQKTCLQLFYLEGKSYDEVVRITGFEYNQVKSYIQNGKRNLKIRLSQENE